MNKVDALGLWYFDLNWSLGWGTVGVYINDDGLYPYAGPAISLPGPGVAWSPNDPSPGKWSWQYAVGIVAMGTDDTSSGFGEMGLPGAGLSWFYTWEFSWDRVVSFFD